MTEKEMRLKRIEKINKKLKTLYKYIEINGTTAYVLEDGTVIRLDSIGKFNAIVIEYADDIESAKKELFGEDGELYYMDELDEEHMVSKIVEEIEG